MKDFTTLKQELEELAKRKMHEHLEHLNWSREKLEDYQLAKLKELLKHAKRHTGFYKEKLAFLDIEDIESFRLEDLSSLPITTKQDTLAHWDEFISDRVINRKQAEEHLQKFRDDETENPFYQDRYLLFATGGSSGERGLFLWDIENFADFLCLAYRRQREDILKGKCSVRKIAAIEAPSWLHGSVPVFASNILENTELKHFPVNMSMEQLIKELEEFQPDQLVGYASIITELSVLARYGKCKIKPGYISTNSEPLDEAGRASIFDAWSVQPNNSWGAVETGVLAHEGADHNGMWTADDYALIELVDENLNPVSNPSQARKVLVTNLFNLSFPLVRYVLEDAPILTDVPGKTFRQVKSIQGRVDDWFCYHENIKIHPMIFRDVLGQYAAISEYQVRQTKNGAKVSISAVSEIDLSSIAQRLVDGLKKAGLHDPVIKMERLEKLPRHDETGKLKRFIKAEHVRMNKKKFAVVGTGFWSNFQINAWCEIDKKGELECVAVCDREFEKAVAFAKAHQIEYCYETIDELLTKHPQLDFIEVITNPQTHLLVVSTIVNHPNSPQIIICQKPIATSYQDALAMEALCKNRNKRLLIHENWRYQPQIIKLLDVLHQHEKELGECKSAEIRCDWYSDHSKQPELLKLERLIVNELGPHLFDTARALFGEAESIKCQTTRSKKELKGEDTAVMTLMMEKCKNLRIYASYANESIKRGDEKNYFPQTLITLKFSTAIIKLVKNYKIEMWKDNRLCSTWQVSLEDYNWIDKEYFVAIYAMLNLLPQLKAIISSSDETMTLDMPYQLQNMLLVEAAYTSAHSKSVVTLETFKKHFNVADRSSPHRLQRSGLFSSKEITSENPEFISGSPDTQSYFQ